MNRRLFLKGSALASFAAGTAPAWLQRAVAAERAGGRRKVLVAVFQRGAADGLNIVVPHGEPKYYEMRPGIAIERSSVIDLDGHFGLHPALAPLAQLYKDGQLAIVHAAGSPDPSRSHFDAQDYMESGTPGVKSTTAGWLNRALPREENPSALRAVALSPNLPKSLRGPNPALAMSDLASFRAPAGFEQAWRDVPAAREAFEAMSLLRSIDSSDVPPADYPRGPFANSLKQIAQLIKSGAGLEVAFADIGGWDTHVNQPGQLASRLGEFGQAIAAFWRDLGQRKADVVLVTMSEFGRTAHENGNRGTDHGHGNVMFVLGGEVRGGRIHGRWPGMDNSRLYEGRDLAVTTDFRDVLAEVVEAQLGSDVRTVFPGYAGGNYTGLMRS